MQYSSYLSCTYKMIFFPLRKWKSIEDFFFLDMCQHFVIFPDDNNQHCRLTVSNAYTDLELSEVIHPNNVFLLQVSKFSDQIIFIKMCVQMTRCNESKSFVFSCCIIFSCFDRQVYLHRPREIEHSCERW